MLGQRQARSSTKPNDQHENTPKGAKRTAVFMLPIIKLFRFGATVFVCAGHVDTNWTCALLQKVFPDEVDEVSMLLGDVDERLRTVQKHLNLPLRARARTHIHSGARANMHRGTERERDESEKETHTQFVHGLVPRANAACPPVVFASVDGIRRVLGVLTLSSTL